MSAITALAAVSRAIDEELSALAERLNPVIVQLGQKGGGNGAGVIWRENGIIVTNRHVVSEDRIDVWTHAGEHHTGIVAARHPGLDLAVVKIAAEGLPAAEIADSAAVRPGQLAFAIGHPVGYRLSLSLGIVTAGAEADQDWIRTDATLMPGNSGGPLFDARGRVIGIGTMVQGALSLAVPSAEAERFVESERPGPANGEIGVEGMTVELRQPRELTGFLVAGLQPGGPAERAGLIVGDVILRAGEREMTADEPLPPALALLRAGAPAELEILRGGKPRRVTVVPAAAAAAAAR
ncbi:MAG: S1C family serine protease [Chloroflexota bacterium]